MRTSTAAKARTTATKATLSTSPTRASVHWTRRRSTRSRVYPGDVGTSGGLLCDEHSQVLTADGEVMPGLYAAGNVTATVMGRTYPGAGASIGASAVFSFIAAQHAAGHPCQPQTMDLPDAQSAAG